MVRRSPQHAQPKHRAVWTRFASLAAAVGVALLVVVVPSTASWAAPSPSPVPSGASNVAPNKWHCERTAAGITTPQTDDCAVTGWATLAPFPPFPTPIMPTPIYSGSVVVPTPVVIVPTPQVRVDTFTVGLCSPQAPPSPSGSAPPSGSSPSASPSSTSSPSASGSGSSSAPGSLCSVEATLERGQAFGLWLFLGALLLLGVVTFLRREGRGFRG